MPFRMRDEVADADGIEAYDVADYVGELAHELSELARGAGLIGTAAALDLARRAAEAEAGRLKAQAKAAPEDAA